MNHKKFNGAACIVVAAMALNGCGGSSPGNSSPSGTPTGAVTGMKIADKVSVVDAKTQTAAPAQKALRRALSGVSVPAGSAYMTDKTFVYVNDRSIEAFSTPNQILCKVAQTRHADMVNKGPYKALVDDKLCGDGGQTSGQAGNAPSYSSWTVEATRADENSPEILKVWVHENHDTEKLIYGRADITAGASDTNPVGLFGLNYAGYLASNGSPVGPPVFKGALRTGTAVDGKVTLQFVDDSEGGLSAATLNRSADGSSGTGTLIQGLSHKSTDIAYNAELFHRVSGLSDKCLSRNDYDLTAWQYGLYDSTTGERINRTSGFPIQYTSNGKNKYGYVGYWGVWTQDGKDLANGSTVYRQSPGGTASTPYSVFSAPGKLIKHTKKQLTLSNIKGVPLTLFDPMTLKQYRVSWDGANFLKDAVMSLDASGQSWQNLETPVALQLSTLGAPDLNFYSDSLGGDLQIRLQGCTMDIQSMKFGACTASDSTPVIFYSRTLIMPGDNVPSQLACAADCPNVAGVANGEPPMYSGVGFKPGAPRADSLFKYSFDVATLTLKDSNGVAITAGDGPETAMGVHTGPLFDPSLQANIDALSCSFPAAGNNTCGWQAWGNLSEFYTWEGGKLPWQHFSTLKNGDSFLTFQQPLQVLYTHNGDGYNGAKFFLQYNGFGDLQGIPGKCVDMETGSDADCSLQAPNSPIRWVPRFSIEDGETVSDSASTSYLVKPLQAEERMKPTTGCDALPVSSYATPNFSIWNNPGQPAEPPVAGAPAVIAGVLQ